MNSDFNGNSRFGYRAKRKKTNLILNGLIVLVLLLIAVVAYSIFFSGGDHTAPEKAAQTAAKAKQDTGSSKQKQDSQGSSSKKQEEQQSDKQGGSAADQQKNTDSQETAAATAATQSGPHTTNYDSNSEDWQQMLSAISKATGVDQSNMTVWFLGSDKGTPNGSVGTISAKDTKQKYRVYLQWVDGQGWTSTKMEQISN